MSIIKVEPSDTPLKWVIASCYNMILPECHLCIDLSADTPVSADLSESAGDSSAKLGNCAKVTILNPGTKTASPLYMDACFAHPVYKYPAKYTAAEAHSMFNTMKRRMKPVGFVANHAMVYAQSTYEGLDRLADAVIAAMEDARPVKPKSGVSGYPCPYVYMGHDNGNFVSSSCTKKRKLGRTIGTYQQGVRSFELNSDGFYVIGGSYGINLPNKQWRAKLSLTNSPNPLPKGLAFTKYKNMPTNAFEITNITGHDIGVPVISARLVSLFTEVEDE